MEIEFRGLISIQGGIEVEFYHPEMIGFSFLFIN